MVQLPKIEKITRDASITHFLLMFGYKVFSLYFPLFFVSRGNVFARGGYSLSAVAIASLVAKKIILK